MTRTLAQQLELSIVMAKLKRDLAAGRAGTEGLFLVPPPARDLSGLPAELYYTGDDLLVPVPPMQPIDETRPLTPSDRDARALIAQGRAGMIRFFAGRWSRRLGKVVRP